MSAVQLPVGAAGPSPFDALRRERADGSEYWLARELMPLLGYESWRRFAEAVDRAATACANQGFDVSKEFAEAVKNPSELGGRPAEDFELSRFACYLTAMNGDPRKPEVAAAQAYFAVRTREAETAPKAGTLDAIRLMIDQIEAADRKAGQAQLEASRALELGQTTEARLDAMEGRHNWFSALGFARKEGMATDGPSLRCLGVRASAVAREHQVAASRAQHSHYGEVNSYPEWVWKLARA